MKLSVIIVSYNAVGFLNQCLKSIKNQNFKDFEVIVWDNASTDRTIENLARKYPTVSFIFNQENLGFSKGNNKAVDLAQGEYVLILNPDTAFDETFFEEILNFAENQPNLGSVGVKMVDGNGDFLPESKRNVPDVLNSFFKLFNVGFNAKKGYYADHLNEDGHGKVEVLSGACMLLKKIVYKEVGGFDERYFMYGEDIDLSFSLLRSGYQNYYAGNIQITHYKGESTIQDKTYVKRFYGAMLLFIEKYEKPRNMVLYMLSYVGILFKYYLARIQLYFNQSGL